MGLADGAVAQLGERLLCKQDVIGSIPVSSTNTLERVICMRLKQLPVGRSLEPWTE